MKPRWPSVGDYVWVPWGLDQAPAVVVEVIGYADSRRVRAQVMTWGVGADHVEHEEQYFAVSSLGHPRRERGI